MRRDSTRRQRASDADVTRIRRSPLVAMAADDFIGSALLLLGGHLRRCEHQALSNNSMPPSALFLSTRRGRCARLSTSP
ncbi:hypothetical protein chiPu_0006086 [Chiloscyllium punctatum]|uniref:Uncharacterized protein n=1 Tax=Chiloscyllium punctatum TaxID=137246 RepID=A0A401SBB5_CHIPU|nr:hypothetical protein [Chiloscyllium punctatum]